MQLNKTLEDFYLSILAYAGLKSDEGIIRNTDSMLGDITIDGKELALPYHEILKNPKGFVVFHPLNENYTNPETEVFDLYKRKLILELNLKLSHLVINTIRLGSDVQLQKQIKSSELSKLVVSLGEIDVEYIEIFLNLVKASQKVNKESFIFDVYLKKNGSIGSEAYSAIGKINFPMYKEICKSLESEDKDYKVYGVKFRKKDLIVFKRVLETLVPSIDDPSQYETGTNNKVFRYLNALLSTTYPVASNINYKIDLMSEIKDASMEVEGGVSDCSWSSLLEEVYNNTDAIRMIPSQVDISRPQVPKLNVNEDKVNKVPATFNPQQRPVEQPQTQSNQPAYQPQNSPSQQPQQLTAEDIIRGGMNNPYQDQAYFQQPMMHPNQMYQPQPMVTPNQMYPQQPMMQPNQMYPQYPVGFQGQMNTGMPIQQQSGIAVNPHFISR